MLLSLQLPKTSYIRKVAFQQIATSNENHVSLAILATLRGVRRKDGGSAEDNTSLTVANRISLYQLSAWRSRCCPSLHVLIANYNIYAAKLSFGNGTYQPKTSERRRGWETSFKSALLLVAEGVISTFFEWILL